MSSWQYLHGELFKYGRVFATLNSKITVWKKKDNTRRSSKNKRSYIKHVGGGKMIWNIVNSV